jgi:predicted ATPase
MTFRIENVVTHSKVAYRSSLSDRKMKADHPISGIDLAFAGRESREYDRNWFTIILGRNSTGKSQLLSDIAEAFCIAAGEFTTRRSSSLNISIRTSLNGKRSELKVDSSFTERRLGVRTENAPSRVLASATTPFDKFRLSKDVIRERVTFPYDDAVHSEQYYFYSGLRDTNGRTNFSTALLRTIRGIFLGERNNLDRLGKLESVFAFLGLQPAVEVTYSISRMSSSRKIIELILSGHPIDLQKDEDRITLNQRRLERFLELGHGNAERVRAALQNILHTLHGAKEEKFEIRINHNTHDRHFLDDLFLLKDLRIITFNEIGVLRLNSAISTSILEASSGEISIIAGVLGIASGIRDNSLILIDEPEISLHPEWQDKYLELLRETFSGFRGCHFVIATHSPIILSDARSIDTTVLNISHVIDGVSISKEHSGKSTDELLATQFGVMDDDNLYLKQEVIRAANSVARGDIQASEFKKRISILASYRKNLGSASKVGVLIDNILEAIGHDKI